MEQPFKRRKLSPVGESHLTSEQTNYLLLSRPPYSHGLQDMQDTHALPRRIDEVHVHLKSHPPEQKGHRYDRRQLNLGTGASSSSVSSTALSSLSASADASESTSSQPAETSDSSESSSPTTEALASTSETSSASTAPTLSSSSPTSETTTSPSGQSINLSAGVSAGGSAGVSVELSAGVSATQSVGTVVSSTGSGSENTTSSSTVDLGAGTTTSSTPSSTPLSSGSLSLTESNGTTVASTSSAAPESSAALAAASSSSRIASNASSISTTNQHTISHSASRGNNFTTSAFVVSNSKTTYTSFSTFDTASSASTTSSSHAEAFTGLGIYTDYSSTITTLSGGVLATISEAREALVTTLSNGDFSTSYGGFSAMSTADSSLESASAASSSLTETSATSPSTTSSRSASSSDASALAGSLTTGTATAPASASSSLAGSSTDNGSSNSGSSTPPASVLAGGIVGGVAGLAVLLLVAMVFLRWYRKRAANMQPLTESEAARSIDAPSAPRGPGMAQRAGLAPVLAPLLGGGVFRSKREAESDAAAAGTGERGFQRVSGRKLPSAFSEGMEGVTSPPPIVPAAFAHDGDLHNSSFYRDSAGFYGGEGPFADPSDFDGGGIVSPRPGPARQPTLHPGGPYAPMSPSTATTVSAPGSPTWPGSGQDTLSPIDGRLSPGVPLSPPGTANRSMTPATMSSFEGSRGSRFTEEV